MLIKTARDLQVFANGHLRQKTLDGFCMTHFGTAEVGVIIHREGSGSVKVRFTHIGGITAAGLMMVVTDEFGHLITISEKHDSPAWGQSTYSAYNVPDDMLVQIRFTTRAEIEAVANEEIHRGEIVDEEATLAESTDEVIGA